MMELVLTTGDTNRAKFQSNHHQQTSNFLQAGCWRWQTRATHFRGQSRSSNMVLFDMLDMLSY